jgi:hypothetical protein
MTFGYPVNYPSRDPAFLGGSGIFDSGDIPSVNTTLSPTLAYVS